ncbi:WAT1-related protein [Rhynchospora pubera]|uniref:WAT1-related protein n=1 Tax=Rhynchospora pubera TaxID=906938 RepID=A0AAV8EQ13_9POAL|nr:WAT1-related protein [Rhynchospora pubera]
MEEEQKEEGGLERWKPAVCMVFVQAFMTGMILLSKIVITEGMFIFALLTYRSLFGALFILPFAFFLERGAWKMLSLRSVGWISLNAFLGYAIPMGLYYYGLQYTTSSYSVIFTNVIPIATYILALIFRMETLRLCTLPGSAKFIGALICFGGTMLVSLYKGRPLHLWPTVIGRHHQVLQQNISRTHQLYIEKEEKNANLMLYIVKLPAITWFPIISPYFSTEEQVFPISMKRIRTVINTP